MLFWKVLSYGVGIVLVFFMAVLSLRPINAQSAEVTPEPSQPLTLLWQTNFIGEYVLISPGDIGIDSDGYVYVSNQTGIGMKKFDSDGKFVAQWGEVGTDDGEFSLALGVTIDPQDNIFVTDFNNKRIQKFDTSGNFLGLWDTESSTSPAFIGSDQWGNIYIDKFPAHGEHYLEKFDTSGKSMGEWGSKGTDDTGKFGPRPEDIAVDADGNVYVADPILHVVHKLDSSGKFIAQFGGESSRNGGGLFFDPFGIAVDPDGNIYVLDSFFLQKLDSEGNFVAQWTTKGGDLDRAKNVQVDADGNIYVFAYADVVNVKGTTVNALVLKKLQQSWTP